MVLNLVMRLLGIGECKFASKCMEAGQYSEKSETCTRTAGIYYQDGTPCGCYRRMSSGILVEEAEEEQEKQK